MTRFRGPGRRGLRDEIQSTWSCYDAVRPIRAEDLAEPSPPVVGRDPNRASPSPDEGTTLRTAHGPMTVTLDDPSAVTQFTEASDADLAMLFGVSEMDVRESRKWAREQATNGTVTVTGIDSAGVITVGRRH